MLVNLPKKSVDITLLQLSMMLTKNRIHFIFCYVIGTVCSSVEPSLQFNTFRPNLIKFKEFDNSVCSAKFFFAFRFLPNFGEFPSNLIHLRSSSTKFQQRWQLIPIVTEYQLFSKFYQMLTHFQSSHIAKSHLS